mgnify:FL=1
MRRRRHALTPRSLEDLVALFWHAEADALAEHPDDESRRHERVAATLAEHGTDIVAVIRARRALRGARSWRIRPRGRRG